MVETRETAKSYQSRVELVATLREQGALRTDALAQAFLMTPRELFLPFFLEQEEGDFRWHRRTADAYDEHAWIAAIYRNEPLVTLVDERRIPISSSSAPVVMAMMLEALEVGPGMSVLEIGTGSGYNAAVLAHLTGDPALVTTIDLEEALARDARQVLHEHVGPVAVEVGDGRQGVATRAPFDRIVATASAPGIPRAWYEQLVPGGRLVMDLQGSLYKSSFLILEKAADGSARGYFDPRYLYFMPLRPGESLATRPVGRLLREPVTAHIELPADETAVTLLEHRDFLWFLQWFLPGISLARSSGGPDGRAFFTLIDPQKETIIQLYLDKEAGMWSGDQRGGSHLWEKIQQAYALWNSLQRPGQTAYHVLWDQSAQSFRLMLQEAPSGASLTFSLDMPE
jgi:protein-L-isoaspartate(D-aspartate) O-methyltransferase